MRGLGFAAAAASSTVLKRRNQKREGNLERKWFLLEPPLRAGECTHNARGYVPANTIYYYTHLEFLTHKKKSLQFTAESLWRTIVSSTLHSPPLHFFSPLEISKCLQNPFKRENVFLLTTTR